MANANYVWRDNVVDGVPASGNNDPSKAEIRAWSADLEASVARAQMQNRPVIYQTATWAALSAITGSTAGIGASVRDTDIGTHTDPVVGGTVANAGVYTWSASPAGWQWIDANSMTAASDAEAIAGTATNRTVTPANLPAVRAATQATDAEAIAGTNTSHWVDPSRVLKSVNANSRAPNILFDSCHVIVKDYPKLGGVDWFYGSGSITWSTASTNIPVATPVAQLAAGLQYKRQWPWSPLGRATGDVMTWSALTYLAAAGQFGVYFRDAGGALLGSAVVGISAGLHVTTAAATVPAGAISYVEVAIIGGGQAFEVGGIFASSCIMPAVLDTEQPRLSYQASWLRAANLASTIAAGMANKQSLDDFAAPSKNLFNPATVTAGYFIDPSTAQLTANASFGTSDFIKVDPSTTYYGGGSSVMRFVAFFDADRAVIAGGPQNTNTFTTPASCYWVRVTYSTSDLGSFQLEKGSAATSYAPFGRSLSIGTGTIGTTQLAGGAATPDKTSFLALGKNLFNKATVTTGYFLGHDNSLTANATYDYSDFIAVTPGQQLVSNYGMRFTTFYNAAKGWVSGGSSTTTSTITVPAGVYFIRVTITAANLDGFQLEVGTSSSGYEKWGYRLSTALVVIDNATPASGWANKSWASLGDSITASGTWQASVVGALGLIHTNYGVGGTKLSGAAGDANAMCQDTRLNAIPTTIDLLTLMGGMNDWAQSVPMGSIGSTDPTTFYGALETFVSKAMARWPGKRIVLCTNTYGEFAATYASRGWANAYTNTLGLTPQDYMAAIRAIGLKYGLPVADTGARAGWNHYNVSSWVTSESGDYIHPLTVGYKCMASVVIGSLKSIDPIA